jgi:RNA polymerase sigma factor (sigma-70 family)
MADPQLLRKFVSLADDDPHLVDIFTDLFREFHQPLITHLRRKNGLQAVDAEEVAQAAFQRAFKARRAFNPSRDFWPWILTIAIRSLCTIKSRKRQHHLGHLGIEPWMVAPNANPEHLLIRQEESQAISSAMDRLEPAKREIIEMSCEMNTSEIAAELGIPNSTARSRVTRACKEARKTLADLNPVPEKALDESLDEPLCLRRTGGDGVCPRMSICRRSRCSRRTAVA